MVGLRVRAGVKAEPRVPRGRFASLDPGPTREGGPGVSLLAIADLSLAIHGLPILRTS